MLTEEATGIVMALAPPPSRPLAAKPGGGPRGAAWLIRDQHRNPFGVHILEKDDTTRTQVVVFRKQHQAISFKQVLVDFHRQHRQWPSRELLFRGDTTEMLLRPDALHPVPSSSSSLSVKSVDLDGDFVEHLALNNISILLVKDMSGDIMDTTSFQANLEVNLHRVNLQHLHDTQISPDS